MATDIDIASNALQLLGSKSITSFDDPGSGAAVAKALYESTLTAMLTRTYWRFTMKKQSLNLLSQTPENDFQFAHQIPTDSLKIYKVDPNCFYKIYQDKIYSNQNTLIADYAFRPDTTLLPSYFVLALTYKLASDFALAVTDNEQKAALFEEKFRSSMAEAYASDAQQNPQTPIVDQPFTDVRFNGNLSGNRFI